MTDSDNASKPKPSVGEELVLEDDLRLGDLVTFDRRVDGRLTIRRLRPEEADDFAGEVLRVEPGKTPTTRALRVFRHARKDT